MLFLNGYKDRELYRITEILSPKNKYYGNSGIPIDAFITPMSVIYTDSKNRLVVKFKKEIIKYGEEFVDEPLEKENTSQCLYELRLESYNKEKPLRHLAYCIEKYKNTTDEEFYSHPISYKLLKELLSSDEYMDTEYSFTAEDYNPLFDGDSYWFPCAIDTVFASFTNRLMRNNAVIAQFNTHHIFGYLGYDSVLYCMDYQSKGEDTITEADLRRRAFYIDTEKNTAREIDVPDWMKNIGFFNFSSVQFLKDYIVLPDNTCIDYCERELPDKSTHYKNVNSMNDLIKLLIDCKSIDKTGTNTPYLDIKAPDNFDTLKLDMVENLIVPMLRSRNLLNDVAYENFLRLRELFIKIGLTTDFATAIVNIATVNESLSETEALCCDELFNTLCMLEKSMDKDDFISLLNDLDRLQEVI